MNSLFKNATTGVISTDFHAFWSTFGQPSSHGVFGTHRCRASQSAYLSAYRFTILTIMSFSIHHARDQHTFTTSPRRGYPTEMRVSSAHSYRPEDRSVGQSQCSGRPYLTTCQPADCAGTGSTQVEAFCWLFQEDWVAAGV